MAKKKKPAHPGHIVKNQKARFEYFIEDTFEAGLSLEGWEVKSLRASKVNLSEAFIQLQKGEAFLMGCQIQALPTASTHISPEPLRKRKLLLHQRELAKLHVATQKDGKTCVPLALYWSKGYIKCEIALATGKKQHDKRATEKNRDWARQKQRVMRRG